ncbi:hypothetical protein QTJ16_005302 [Diplocarpon rosae]|uniref:Uncharacterized protein n=1 Tax=Diplocarpon rosae TaxID=946125 RepID=A0AAD9WC61_9HELO|nr:hypothetical protein QTJ16_005302 [Diplocarpon rosae]
MSNPNPDSGHHSPPVPSPPEEEDQRHEEANLGPSSMRGFSSSSSSSSCSSCSSSSFGSLILVFPRPSQYSLDSILSPGSTDCGVAGESETPQRLPSPSPSPSPAPRAATSLVMDILVASFPIELAKHMTR